MARPIRKAVDRVLLQALACGATVENAARKAGVCERTVYRRLEDPAFGRRAKVENLYLAGRCQHQVLRLDVAMNHAALEGVLQARGCLADVIARLLYP
jgi:hypothetical protein